MSEPRQLRILDDETVEPCQMPATCMSELHRFRTCCAHGAHDRSCLMCAPSGPHIRPTRVGGT
eukprot:14284932-Alexandrium_andersonii.AAC.1